MIKSSEKLPFNFKVKKPLDVNFSGLDLSSDAGLLLVKQAEENLKVAQGVSTCLEDDREQH
ncbi:MAG: transposase, partial [Crocosphaera sp.]|nr:transposase [Crocosphaera sp.]